MLADKIPEERLFLNNNKEDVVRWSNMLHYFRYIRGRAGHNCEGDSFSVYFSYEGIEDLSDKLSKLGVTLKEVKEGFIAYDPFESYSFDDLDKLKNIVPATYNLEQPQGVDISGYKANVWVSPIRFEVSVSGSDSGSSYKVSEADFEVCMALEQLFDRLGWQQFRDDSILSLGHCVSPAMYPELF